MLPETMKKSPEKVDSDLNLMETELTLGLPGGNRGVRDAEGTGKATAKRGFLETVDLNLGSSILASPADISGEKVAGKPSATKAQVVGWPPVRSYRMNALKTCMYVKVAMDGAPYLRKIDLEVYDGYQPLLKALEKMFGCFTIYLCETRSGSSDSNQGLVVILLPNKPGHEKGWCGHECFVTLYGNSLGESNVIDRANVNEYVATYEDKDGDWMLVGDVPWKMFVESCKRMRLMKSTEAIGLASPKCTS